MQTDPNQGAVRAYKRSRICANSRTARLGPQLDHDHHTYLGVPTIHSLFLSNVEQWFHKVHRDRWITTDEHHPSET